MHSDPPNHFGCGAWFPYSVPWPQVGRRCDYDTCPVRQKLRKGICMLFFLVVRITQPNKKLIVSIRLSVCAPRVAALRRAPCVSVYLSVQDGQALPYYQPIYKRSYNRRSKIVAPRLVIFVGNRTCDHTAPFIA